MNWRAGGMALIGAALGSAAAAALSRLRARRLALHPDDGTAHEGSSLLVGASIGAIIGASLASEPARKAG